MLNIYTTNTYNSGSRYIMQCLTAVDQRQLDIRHIVIVPDRCSLEAERQMLNSVGGSFNIEILTFSRLATRILSQYNYMTKQAGVIATTAVINDNIDKLECYVKGSKSVGFADSMYKTISQLKYCKVSPETIINTTFDMSLSAKMQDIAIIYQGYQDIMQQGYVDSADKLELLNSNISSSEMCKNSFFYLYDFDNLTAQQLSIISTLTQYSLGVTVACCRQASYRDKYIYTNDIYDNLMKMCHSNNIQPSIIEDTCHVNDKTAHIGKHLFHYDQSTTIDNDNFVQVFQGDTRLQEVRQLASQIAQYVRKGGRYKDIYVVTSDINSYSNAITTVFQEVDIPYFCDRQFCLYDHQYVQMIMDYLNMSANMSQGNILAVAKNALLPLASHISDFENYCYKYNVKYSLEQFALGADDVTYSNADIVREYMHDILCHVVVPTKATATQYVAIIRELISYCQLDVLLDNFATLQQDNGLEQYAKASLQVRDKVCQTLTQLDQLMGDREVTLEEITQLLAVAMKGVSISVLPTKSDAVIFANMSKARKHDIVVLAMLGCNSGAIPLVEKDVSLLTDHNINTLSQYGIMIDPDTKTANKRERFSLYQLLQEPSKGLWLSYAMSSGKDSMLPASWVENICQLFTHKGQPLTTAVMQGGVYSARQALSTVIANRQRLQDNQAVSLPYYKALYEYFREDIDLIVTQKDAISLSLGTDNNVLTRRSSSVSRICQYYKCPYNYFFTYGLGVKPRKKALLEANLVGDILHAVLENYVGMVDVNESDTVTRDTATKLYDNVMQDDYYKAIFSDISTASLYKQLRLECCRLCIVVKKQLQKSNFQPYKCEMTFAQGGDIPPVVVEYGGNKITLNGKIDRVDVCGDQFIVIDYKSGSNTSYTEKELYVGHKLQLLVYLKALMREGRVPVGYYYFQLHNKFSNKLDNYSYNGRTLNDLNTIKLIDNSIVKGKSQLLSINVKKDGTLSKSTRLLSASQIDAQIDYCMAMIGRACQLMEEGYIAINPYKGSCEYCDYKEVCDYNDIFSHQAREVSGKVTADTIGGNNE